MDVLVVKDWALLILAGSNLLSMIGAVAGTWKLLGWRMDKIEKILSNGHGLVPRMEQVEKNLEKQIALCGERHRARAN